MVLKVSNNIINEMQNTTSMVENFPDAIKCTKDTIFLLSYGHHTYREYDQGWYAQVGASSFSGIKFNADGTYHSRNGLDQSTKGCLGKSIQQLYDQGRAFNFVNDPRQAQQLQKQAREIQELEDKIENILEEMNDLKQTCNDPSKLNSSKCFEMFKEKNIEMCIISRDIRVVSEAELNKCKDFCVPIKSWTINKHDNESDYDACMRSFSGKGFVLCNDEEYVF